MRIEIMLTTLLIYSFLTGNKMNSRTKKRIVLEALAGGTDSTDALVLAMLVPFIHDHELAIREVKKYVPRAHLGLFTSRLCDELKNAGSSSTAKICYGAFKKEINKHIEKTSKKDVKPPKPKAAKK